MVLNDTDPTMQAINDAIAEGRAGNVTSARATLLDLWAGLGDPLHRCWLAHSLADLYDDPARSLAWDVRALDAADALDAEDVQERAGISLPGCYPSLHLNLADNYRRLGSFEAAAEYLERAEAVCAELPDDAYGEMMRPLFGVERELLARRDTSALDAATITPGSAT